MHLLGVGVPSWPSPSTEWDWWPFVGIVIGLVVARRSLRLRLRPVVLVAAVAFGPLFSLLVHSWGAIEAMATVVVAAAALTWARTRRMGDDPASPV